MIASGCLNLLKIFGKQTDQLTDRQANKLVLAFGPFSGATARQARMQVDRIRNTLPQYDRCIYEYRIILIMNNHDFFAEATVAWVLGNDGTFGVFSSTT